MSNECIKKDQLFRLKKVLCEEEIILEDIEIDVPVIRTENLLDPVPPGSELDSTRSKTQVTIKSCMLEIIDQGDRDAIQVEIEAFIDKKIVINRPGLPPLDMEFSFVKEFTRILETCDPADFCPEDLKHIGCKIWDFNLFDRVTIDPVNDTFDDELIIEAIIKIEADVQMPLPIKKEPKPEPPEPVLPIDVDNLVTAIGKVRNVIPTGPFKDDLLLRLAQIEELLAQGQLLEAITVLTTVIEKLDFRLGSGDTNIVGINLAINDLLRLKQELLDLL